MQNNEGKPKGVVDVEPAGLGKTGTLSDYAQDSSLDTGLAGGGVTGSKGGRPYEGGRIMHTEA